MIPALHLVGVPASELRVGQFVPCYNIKNHADAIAALILRIEPRFNPAFVPVVFDTDPHYAVDVDVNTVVSVIEPA